MNASPIHSQTPLNEHVFSSSATVFTLEDKNWTERGCGLVKFIFDLSSYQLRLVIRPQTPQEFECRLRPRIRSKGPRAYVVRANSINRNDEDGEELILAIRFDREIDSRAFRRFVEERDQPSLSNFTPDARNAAQPAAPVHHQSYNSHGQSSGHGDYIQNDRGGERYHHSTSYQDEQPANDGFFWSCSRCTMMNDAQAPACYVCGTQRDVVARGGAASGGATGGGTGAGTSDVPMPHYGNGYGSGHGPGYHGHHQSTTPTPASPQPERMQVQLTQQNLERLNLLYPPKKRSVLEIILEQLRLQERLSMAENR